MRAVVQRVARARVETDGRMAGQIGQGLLVLVGMEATDGEPDVLWMARKIAELRVFADDEGRMNRSVRDAGGEVLVVSQFTLLGDCRKGRRPSFDRAAPPEKAERLYQQVVDALRAEGLVVATGAFGAFMAVSLVNDGPVTLLLDSQRVF
jgi:D-tyrosyl-tRNA(Tyr) deacylase